MQAFYNISKQIILSKNKFLYILFAIPKGDKSLSCKEINKKSLKLKAAQ